MRTLLARGLIEEAGHDQESGAVLFATTSYFLERMGLKALQDLPPLPRSCPRWRSWRPSSAGTGFGGISPQRLRACRAGPRSGPGAASVTEPATGVRLQKVLAAAGIASRRACEVLINEGRVEVNSEVVTEQGREVDPERDVIRVDGARIPPPRRHRYLALNKPRGVVATMDDPEGRRTVADLLAEPAGRSTTRSLKNERLFRRPAGHRQRRSADPDQRRRLRPPAGAPLLPGAEDLHRRGHRGAERADPEAPARGITLDDGPVRPSSVKIISSAADKTLLKITLQEGRNRIVRRTMEAVGHPVRRLTRIGIGPVRLGNLKVGEYRGVDPRGSAGCWILPVAELAGD